MTDHFLSPRGVSPRPDIHRTASSHIIAGLALALVVAQCLAALFVIGEALGDLAIYRGALIHTANGGNLYEFRYEHEGRPDGYPFTYPPFAAILMFPLAWLPAGVTDILWTAGVAATAIAIALVVAVSATTDRFSEVSGQHASFRVRWEIVLLILALSYPLLHNVILGEISLLIALLALVDGSGIVPTRFRGVLVGVAAAVKLTPLIFIAYFVVTRQRRAAMQAITSFSVATAAGFLLMPSASREYWGSRIFETGNVGEISSGWNKAIAGLLARLGLDDVWLLVVWVVVASIVGLMALYRARVHYRDGDELHAAVVVGCASVAVSPISWAHHQVWGVLAAVVVLHTLRTRMATAVAGGTLLVFFALSPTQGLSEGGSTAMTIAWELPTLVFVVVSLAGLPRSGRRA